MSAASPDSPKTPSPVLKAAADTLKLVVGMANTPGGLALATTLLGVANPAILLVEQFGVRILGPLLVTWTGADCTEDDVTTSLATRGHKVGPFDPMKAFS
jgi:hypothetical protein